MDIISKEAELSEMEKIVSKLKEETSNLKTENVWKST